MINGALVVPLSQYTRTERERERESRHTDRQTDRERDMQVVRHVNQNVFLHQTAESQKEILASKKRLSFKTELDDFDKCVGRRTVNEIYGRKKIRQFMHSAVYHLRSRHPNVPEQNMCQPLRYWVLGRTVGRLRKQQAKVLASEIKMLLFLYKF